MALKFTPYILPLVTGSIPLVIVAVTIAWRRAERLYAPFVLLLLGVAEWCLTYALEIASTTLKSALFWARAEYIGVALVGACMPICALVYSSRERHITLRNVLLLCVVPVITVVSVYTNDLHFAFWTSYGYDPSAPVFALQLGHGVLFWVNIAYSYAALLFTTTAFLVMLRRSKGLLRVHIILLLLAALVPLVSHVLHLTGLSPVHFIELTPLSFAISGLMLAWGVFRKRLFDIVPIARHAVVEHMADGVLVLDPQGRVVDMNASAERLLGASRAKVMGKPVSAVPQLGTLPDLSSSTHTHLVLGNATGSARRCELTISPLYASDMTLTGRFLILHDVTEQLRLEDQLRQARKMEAIGQLAGGIAHEFNNQLQIINGYAEFALEQLGPASPIRGDLDVIQRAGKHSANLTQQLVAFSRQQSLHMTRIDLNALIESLEKSLLTMVGERIPLELRLASDVKPVQADAGQLTQVLINLVTNARDAVLEAQSSNSHTTPGRVGIETANVSLDTAFAHSHAPLVPGDYVMLSVTDDGTGLSEQARQHLFEPFFTTKVVGRGAGLGLAAVYGIVKQSNGWIYAESPPEGGTAMTIYLPPAAPEAPTTTSPSSPADLPAGRARVLVLDDCDDVSTVTARMLSQQGYHVSHANSAESAHRMLSASVQPFDLLVADVSMSGDGVRDIEKSLRRAQAERFPHRPLRVLYMSGYVLDTLVAQGSIAPDAAFLPKPFTLEQLAEAVSAALAPSPHI